MLFPRAFSPGQGRAGTLVTRRSRTSKGHGFTLEVAQVMASHAQGNASLSLGITHSAWLAGSQDPGLENGVSSLLDMSNVRCLTGHPVDVFRKGLNFWSEDEGKAGLAL